MKLATCLSFVALAVTGCHKPPPPATAASRPVVEAPPKLVFGLALPWGPDVGIERARVASAYLAKAIPAEITPKLFSYDELADALDKGEVDIAFIPPFGYVKAAAGGNVKLLRRAKHEGVAEYRAVLFTRRDSPVKTIDDLKGKDVAWVREGSASGNLFPQAWLVEHHIDGATFFAKQAVLASHNDVCNAVDNSEFWAGASFTDATKEFDTATVDGCVPALGDKAKDLKIIFATDPIPNDVIAVSGRLAPSLVERIGAAFDALSTTDEGRRVLKDGFASEGFVGVSDADFDVVRRALAEIKPAAKSAP